MEHTVVCWYCSTPFDAIEAAWCGCSPTQPTKTCPFCYTCACTAPQDYQEAFRDHLPEQMRQELATLGQPKKKIGELLVERGRITGQQLGEVLEQQRQSGNRLGDILVDRGLASREELSRHLAEQQEMGFVDFDPKDLDLSLIQSVGPRLCLQYGFVPLDHQEVRKSRILIIAVAEPLRPADLERLGEKLDCKVYQKFARPDLLKPILGRLREAVSRVQRTEASP